MPPRPPTLPSLLNTMEVLPLSRGGERGRCPVQPEEEGDAAVDPEEEDAQPAQYGLRMKVTPPRTLRRKTLSAQAPEDLHRRLKIQCVGCLRTEDDASAADVEAAGSKNHGGRRHRKRRIEDGGKKGSKKAYGLTYYHKKTKYPTAYASGVSAAPSVYGSAAYYGTSGPAALTSSAPAIQPEEDITYKKVTRLESRESLGPRLRRRLGCLLTRGRGVQEQGLEDEDGEGMDEDVGVDGERMGNGWEYDQGRTAGPPADELEIGDLETVLGLCQNLDSSFKLTSCLHVSSILLQSLADFCPHLESLELRGCPVGDGFLPELVRSGTPVTAHLIRAIAQRATVLERLILSSSPDHITDDVISAAIRSFPRLMWIEADWCPKITELSLQTLAVHRGRGGARASEMHPTQLWKLAVSGTGVTAAGVKMLAKECWEENVGLDFVVTSYEVGEGRQE
ncbi:hypothetical protein BC829DRAFT_416358 [Chytridium lagenaria]|nr:hypothetical protein BC829DRAFT_416358 [Chytridium lagenaria]